MPGLVVPSSLDPEQLRACDCTIALIVVRPWKWPRLLSASTKAIQLLSCRLKDAYACGLYAARSVNVHSLHAPTVCALMFLRGCGEKETNGIK